MTKNMKTENLKVVALDAQEVQKINGGDNYPISLLNQFKSILL
jgi:hypothetical protein